MYGFLSLQDNTGEVLRDSLFSEFLGFRLYLGQIKHDFPFLRPVLFCDFVDLLLKPE